MTKMGSKSYMQKSVVYTNLVNYLTTHQFFLIKKILKIKTYYNFEYVFLYNFIINNRIKGGVEKFIHRTDC
jgi:hypothetical protein